MLGLSKGEQHDLFTLFTRSAREFLDGWFESDPIKAVLGFDSIVGHFASPDTPGSAYVLLHHVFGQVNGVKGAWGHAIGGMGAITQAMARSAQAAGADIRVNHGVRELLTAQGRVCGAMTTQGTEFRAPVVVSNLNPKLLFLQLLLLALIGSACQAWACPWSMPKVTTAGLSAQPPSF